MGNNLVRGSKDRKTRDYLKGMDSGEGRDREEGGEEGGRER